MRARITTPSGLWMTTNTRVMVPNGGELLRLRLVAVGVQQATQTELNGAITPPATTNMTPNTPDPCANLTAQADLNRCAFEDFENAGSGYAQRYAELSKPLPAAQRDLLRRMQLAWLKYSNEACRYESGPTKGGSVQGFIYWRCQARMTRDRTAELQRLATCREGDVTCSRRVP